jgi:hypothetical protein
MAAHRALIVIGMHRSGTSALTRVVNILGAALPSQLLELDPAIPHETNELGLWEGLEVNTLNNEFLSSIGSSWDDTARIPETVFRSDAARFMRDRIVRHLEAEFKDAPLFAIKDPRIARLAPLWIEALKAFGAEPNFILAFRNPAEVAQSLLKRDQMGRGQATLLWLRYMLEAERNTRNFRRSFVPYEALLENWRGAARRIAEDCDFVWPRFNAGAEFPQWPHDVHDVFQLGASGACLDVDVVDRISAELDRAGAVFDGYICELDLKVRRQSNDLQELELALGQRQKEAENLQSLEERCRQLDAALSAKSGEVADQQAKLEAASMLAQKLVASEQERRQLEQRLSQAQAEARTALLLRRRLEEANSQSDHVRAEVERNERRVENANAALATTKITLSTMARKLQEKTLEANSAIAELAKTRSELHLEKERVDEVLASLASAFSELNIPKEGRDDAVTDLPVAHLELNVLKGKLRERDDLEAQLEALLASRTWRLTMPVRQLISKVKIIFARLP